MPIRAVQRIRSPGVRDTPPVTARALQLVGDLAAPLGAARRLRILLTPGCRISGRVRRRIRARLWPGTRRWPRAVTWRMVGPCCEILHLLLDLSAHRDEVVQRYVRVAVQRGMDLCKLGLQERWKLH